MTPHHAERGGEAESPSQEFGGEERVEDLVQRVRIHAAAGVAHHQLGVPVRRETKAGEPLRQLGFGDIAHPHPHGDLARMVSDRLRAVEHQVQHQLL
jgi:hypothetical protein